MGWPEIVGRWALLAEVDFDYLHDAAAAGFRFAIHEQAGAEGLHTSSRARAAARRRHRLRHLGKMTRRGETRVTGMVLSILSYFEYDDGRLETVANHLLEQQMPDGGWNCRRGDGATHSSVHTTISVLEGLRLYELYRGRDVQALQAAQVRGREFLLKHRLFRSHRTGEIIKPAFLRFSFPPRWHYDILRALDYFQSVNAPYDERLAEAIEIVRGGRRADGRWALQNRYRGKTYFEMERVGGASRWNTLGRCGC